MNQPKDALVRPSPASISTLDLSAAPAVTQERLEMAYRQLAVQLTYDEQMFEIFERRCERMAKLKLHGYDNTNSVMIAGMQGFALGLDLMSALKMIRVIHGRPSIRGPEAVAFIRRRCPGATLECTETTEVVARWKMARPGGQPREYVAMIEEIRKAGLLARKDSAWNNWPRRCLKWHAASEGVQELFGDILGGATVEDLGSEDGELEGTPPGPSFYDGMGERVELDREDPELGVVSELVNRLVRLRLKVEDVPPDLRDLPPDERTRRLRQSIWDDLKLNFVRRQGGLPTLAEARTMQASLTSRCDRIARTLVPGTEDDPS